MTSIAQFDAGDLTTRGGKAHPALHPGEAHVWKVALDQSPEPFESLLSPEELVRRERFRFEEGRVQFAITRGALRILLGGYLERDPSKLRFVFTEKGKPFLAGERLRFNVAHSGRLALIAMTLEAAIGVDIEHTGRSAKIDDTAPAILSPDELNAWKALDHPARRASFFKHWVAKEAYLKAIGIGLGRDPRTLEISKLPVKELAVPGGYTAAVAVLGDCPDPQVLPMA